MEEMWSDREISLRQVYCPTHVTPLELYVKRMMNVGLRANSFSGVNPAVLAVSLTRLLASREKVIEGDFSEKVKSSKLLSKLVHFAMGIGVLSAVFLPQGKYNPHLSLHTILTCRKERNRMKQIVFVRESTEP